MLHGDSADCVVIGAGVVGLAIARELAQAGREVVVLEAEAAVGSHTSSRNSEVIHAGIYYAPESLKARLCVDGRERLYRYCEERRVPFRRTGKLIVGSSDTDEDRLKAIEAQARACGVDDLEWLDRTAVCRREPEVHAEIALWSPSTGIVDSHTLMLSLQADIEAAGGAVVCRSPVGKIRYCEPGFAVSIGPAGHYELRCRTLVNAAGLWGPDLARRMTGLPADQVPRQWFAKAHYFTYRATSPFKTLVYPLPGNGGLGIHATLDLGGQTRFGPDVQWTETLDYTFDKSRKPAFVEAIRSYFPSIEAERLAPAYTGIRPKLAGPGQEAADFMLQHPGDHGVPGLINLFGIESPGLTSALAIAGEVQKLVHESNL